jgi:enoyl-[acyl-carrier protein] reductase II
MKNRVCQILGTEKPVIQGPLSWLTDACLVAAVSNAGGLGVLGPNAGLTADTAVSTPEETAEKMREEIVKPNGLPKNLRCEPDTNA